MEEKLIQLIRRSKLISVASKLRSVMNEMCVLLGDQHCFEK